MRHVFADCELDTDTLTLTRQGRPVTVEPQVFDLIRLLAENSGRVVTRDEIIEVVWKGRIVSESAISARIAAARKAVGDDGKQQAVIRTVARRGLQMVSETGVPTPPCPASQRIRYTADDEGRAIAYTVTGSGPPLLRVGYNTTHLEAEWNTPSERQCFDRLARQFSLLRFDPVGFGMSERCDIAVDFSTLAENALRAADAAGFETFAAYSESGGVHTALALAAHHPDRISKLAIVGGYANGRARRGARPPDTFHSLVSEGWDTPASPFAAALLYSYFPEGPLDAVQAMGRNMQQASSKANLLGIRTAIDEISAIDLLPRITCPTLIIHARDDAVHPLSEARKLAAGIDGAEMVVLETANHIPIPGNPVWEDFMTLLEDFLRS
ncbi:alpha/beta fold hydrolase [Nioella aestuarii]|uniref:alpha/beta fold hydrolase n=1 Tax=Nioella aestuarii TaxID=1662864 RepID=UPI003D7FBFD3